MSDNVPVPNRELPRASGGDVFTTVVGQPALVQHLRASVAAPVHAYLLVGPAGAGGTAAARALAAALLCPQGGCGACRGCRLALAGKHPDAPMFVPSGASMKIDDARSIIHEASLSTVEGGRRVYILTEMHRVQEAGPALLKIIEEPPEGVVFVLLADDVSRDLVPLASRCVRLDVVPLSEEEVAAILVAEGVEAELSAAAAAAAFGDLDRARLVAADPGVAERRDAWAGVPERLDGTGATVATIVEQLLGLIETAAEPIADRHRADLAALQERAEMTGERLSGMRKEAEARNRREQRRHRAMELRFGLAVVGERYREQLAGDDPGPAVRAIDAIAAAGEAITRNANERLMLQDLLLRLTPIRTRRAATGLVASTVAPE